MIDNLIVMFRLGESPLSRNPTAKIRTYYKPGALTTPYFTSILEVKRSEFFFVSGFPALKFLIKTSDNIFEGLSSVLSRKL